MYLFEGWVKYDQQEDNSMEDDNINLLVKKFSEFLKKDKMVRFSHGRRFGKK